MGFCRVILRGSLETFSNQELQTLTYSIPEELKESLAIGSLVLVPFRNRKENALVIDIYNSLSQDESNFKIREIEELLSLDLYSQELVNLIQFVAEYYSASYSEVLETIIPSQFLPKLNKTIQLTDLTTNNSEPNPIINSLQNSRKKNLSWSRLKSLSNLDSDNFKKEIKKLIQKKIIKITYENKNKKQKKSENHADKYSSNQAHGPHVLNPEQAEAFKLIKAKLQSQSEILIHGVTGSGKTEIYLHTMKEVLTNNQSIIFLVPEIALAPQLIERIIERFGTEDVLIWHSALSNKEKEHTLEKLQESSPKIIVGARSAIFCPVKNLGLIIIDEEHENSYKQESPAPRYNARLVASKRAEINNCPVIYGSATPSLELYYKAKSPNYPNYHLLTLSKRVMDRNMPEVCIIDMREEFNHGNKSIFSKQLKNKIDEALSQKEQIILFLNKRGSASHVFCRNCGFVYKCQNCDSKIVYHSDKKILLCHYCNYSEEHPKQCPQCHASTIKFFGLGTQKLEEETKRIFPEAKVGRLDSDNSKIKGNYFSIWNSFKNGEIDILVGTQMIAKGFDLPKLTVVGVVFADANFSQIDYAADERSFQLLTQVAGRAGRAERPGSVVFQTYQPDKEIILNAQNHNYLRFYDQEIQMREELGFPPFGQLIKFLFSSEQEDLSIASANDFHEEIFDYCHKENISLMGPCPALISKVNNKYRYHIIAKIPGTNEKACSELKQAFLKFRNNNKSKDVNILIDVDNVSLY